MAGGGKPKRYRERAEGLRKIAASLPENHSQRMLLSIALEYEQLARLLEEDPVDGDPVAAFAALKKPEGV